MYNSQHEGGNLKWQKTQTQIVAQKTAHRTILRTTHRTIARTAMARTNLRTNLQTSQLRMLETVTNFNS